MNDCFSFDLEFSEFDLSTLILALSSQRDVKNQILRFYDEHPDEVVMTPLDLVRNEVDTLDRLLCMFRNLGEACAGD